MAEQSRRASLIYAARGVGSRGGSLAASFAETWIIYHVVRDTAAVGRFFVSYAVLTVIATVVRFGLESLLLKVSAADADLARPLLRPVCTLAVAFGALGSVAAFVFCGFYLPGIPVWTLLLYASSVLASNLTVVAGALLRGLGRITAGSVAELGSVFGLTFLFVAAAALVMPSVDLGLILLLYCLATWTTVAWALPMALRAAVRESALQPAQSVKEMLRERGASLRQFMITTLGYYLFARAGQIILLLQPVQAAYFGAALPLATLVGTVPAIQISYLSPRFANLFHHGEIPALNQLIRRSTITGTVVASLFALPLVVVPHLVLQIYKAQYAQAWLTLLILAAAAALQVAIGPVQGLLVTCGFERQAARITLILLVAGTLLMVLVLPWGAPAVALANSVANLAYVATGAVLLHRSAGIISPLGPSLERGARSSSSTAPRAGR